MNPKNALNLEDKTFHSWTVLKRVANKYEKRHWLCRCKCGKEAEISSSSLNTGHSRQCASCLARKNSTVHGFCRNRKKTLEYYIWNSMKQRCHNKNNSNFHRYGARGIIVCIEWRNDFAKFYSDMGPKPFPTASIDRIDPEKGYSKKNCRWASIITQASNKVVAIPFHGQRLSITRFSRIVNKCRFFVAQKWKEGYLVDQILKMPSRPFKEYERKGDTKE